MAHAAVERGDADDDAEAKAHERKAPGIGVLAPA